MAKRKKKRRNNDSLSVGYYVVAFLDLLGQQEYLRNLDMLTISKEPENYQKLVKELKNTYGVVCEMRSHFKSVFQGFLRKQGDYRGLNPELFELLSAEQKKLYDSLNNHPIKIQSFSDATVGYMPLSKSNSAKFPIRGVWGILAASAITFLTCLAGGHPVRGGIDVGIGVEIAKHEIYGSALSRAYTLESKISGYPRITIGNQLIEYLQTLIEEEGTDIVAVAEKHMAAQCLNCIIKDDDAYLVLHYLGDMYKPILGEEGKHVIKAAYKTVESYIDFYKKNENSKLAIRYTSLKKYFDTHVQFSDLS